MIAVIELSENSVAYNNVLSIGRALTFYGIDVKVWDSRTKPLLQMIEDLNPYLIFKSSDIIERVLNKIKANVIEIERFADDVICDPLSYKKIGKSKLFETDEICIVQFPEIEDRSNIELRKRLSSSHRNGFRLFCDLDSHGNKYCGKLPIEMYSLAFSSAKSVFALSEHVAVNASLCNDNVTLIDKKYSLSREDMISKSNLVKSIDYCADIENARYKADNFFEEIK